MDRRQALASLIGAALAGCGRKRPLTVGSKNFTEQVILGEIIARHCENRLKVPVARKLDIGGTLLAHEALITGGIDLYPEYTGTALTAVLQLPPETRPDVVLERVRNEYRSRWRVEWLDPLGFSNDFAMVVRGQDARANRLETLSDAAQFQPGWALGVGYEFLTRPDGLPALMKVYSLRLKGAPKTMDLGLLYKALEQNQVSMVAGSATDGLLSVLDLKILRDDKGVFPPYQTAIAVRSEALEAQAGLRQALAELSGKFTVESVRKLNYQVDGNHRRPAEVAEEFLRGM